MRIAFAIEHFKASQGGAEMYAWGLAQWLIRQGCSLDVYAAHPVAVDTAPIRVQVLEIPALPRHTWSHRFANILGLSLAAKAYDVVLGFSNIWPCDLLRLGGGVHVAYEEHNIMSRANLVARFMRRISHHVHPYYRSLREHERRQFGDLSRQFIANSAKVVDEIKRFYPACLDRVHLVWNGTDLNRYNRAAAQRRRAQARQELGLSADTLAFLFVSNNFRLKGLNDLILALPEVEAKLAASLKLLVVGRGRSGTFVRKARSLGVQSLVQFCGTTADPMGYYAAADVLVHPSYYDSYGFVCLEAMACGLPLVVSRNCGVSGIVSEGRGSVLVTMPCPTATLADALLRASSTTFRQDAAEVQWRIASSYPIEANYRAVSDLCEQIAAHKPIRS